MPAFFTGEFWDLANAEFWVGAGLVVFFGILVLVKVPATEPSPAGELETEPSDELAPAPVEAEGEASEEARLL